jgi:Family of unknown function (DUF5677)
MPDDDRRVRLLTEVETPQLREATDDIRALIAERLPMMFDADDDWPPVAHGFLARSGTLLEALTTMVERDLPGEAQMILRILFEHVATFLWLAIDPEPNVARWKEWARWRVYQTHKGAQRFGLTVLPPEELRQAKEARAPIKMAKLTLEVDRYWSQQSKAFRPFDEGGSKPPSILTFRGFYTAVYSKTSNHIHADIKSVDRFATMPLPSQINLNVSEKHSESNDYPAFSIALVGFLLIAFGQRFDWPDESLTRGIIDGLTYYND